ncbi:excisionase family DNA-binding protein [Blautia producta]|nr:excisionase family DNA-binding protein [Blautia parvula]
MLTIQQAADETGLSYGCIRKWCLEKRIVFVRSGKKYLINMDRLGDYLNGESEEGGAQDAEGNCNIRRDLL